MDDSLFFGKEFLSLMVFGILQNLYMSCLACIYIGCSVLRDDFLDFRSGFLISLSVRLAHTYV